MRTNVRSILVFLIILGGCTKGPSASLLQPRVTQLNGEAGYDSALLEATLENAGNIISTGFYLWDADQEKLRKECQPEGNRITARFTGLIPSTNYQYAVFLYNGKQEVLSQVQYLTTEKTPMPELVETQVATTATSAKITARFTDYSFLSSCELYLWEENSSTRTLVSSEINGDMATFSVTGLAPETKYSYSISISNGAETSSSETLFFETT